MNKKKKGKRTASNISTDSSFEADSHKKEKIVESEEGEIQDISTDNQEIDTSVSVKKPAIMIKDLGARYANNPSLLKSDLDKLNLSQFIQETKITTTNHLVFTFCNLKSYNTFQIQIKHIESFNKCQIIDLNKKQKHMIIIKGLNFAAYKGFI